MAIKQDPVLSKDDFESALVTLRLSVSEVARETGIPRHVVSHYRNYGDGMKPEQIAKLRDYLEDRGIEFTDQEAYPRATPSPNNSQAITLPIILSDDGLTQRTALVCRHFFIDERLAEAQINEAGERIHESFTKARELLEVELGTSWGNYNEETETRIRELWGHLARIGLLSLQMQGRILIDQERILSVALPEDERPKPKTLGDLLVNTYRDALAGFYNPPADPDEEHSEEEEEEEETA